MDEKNYDCKNDLEFKKVMENDFSKDTIESYRTSINMFCRINKKSYSDIISEIRDEQFDRIEDNRIIRYNPNQGKVALYCNNLINYYLEKGSSKQTIHSRLNHIRSMLKKSGIILPQKPKIAINNEIETIISRKDIQSIFKFCSIWRKAQISFLASTGMRIYDMVNLTIDDFIEATTEYHDFIYVDDFVNNAPSDMVGFWDFKPHKTRKLGLECRVCNTPESSNYILETLKRRKEILKEKGEKLAGEDPLFISERTGYNKPLHRKSVTVGFWYLNKEFQNQLKYNLDEKLRNNEITRKEYKRSLENLPKLHPHGLRKFFTTTVRNYTTNRDISLIMEGHTSPFKMDKHYVGANDELFSDELIKQTYYKIIPYLTFNQEVDPIEYESLKLTEKKYENQLKRNNELEKQIQIIHENLLQLQTFNDLVNKNSVLKELNLMDD